MWTSVLEWEREVTEWRARPLPEIDIDALDHQVQKHTRAIGQLERGLPANDIVPALKEKVATMREKIPVRRCCGSENADT